MLAVVEMMREENKKIRRAGIREGRREVIKHMLQNGIKIEQIKKMTGLTDREIEEARNSMKVK